MKRRRNGFKSTLPSRRKPPALKFDEPLSRARTRIHAPELKHHDLNAQVIPVLSSGVFGDNPLNAIQVGDTAVRRIGNRITIKKIGLRMQMLNTANTDDGDILRIIVLLDKQPNGADPAVLDILEVADEQAFRAVKTMKRFTFLMDKYVAWSSQSLVVDGMSFVVSRRAITWFKDVNIDVEYLSSGTSISNIGTNAIHVFAISQQASDTTLTYGTRVSYIDY